MAGWWNLLPREIPALGRMALGYADLLAADAGLARVALGRRVRLTVVCVFAGLLSTVSGLILLVAATWDTPYRFMVLAGLTIGFGVIALITGLSGGSGADLFQNVRAEWQGDQAALSEFLQPRLDDGRQNPS